MSPSRWTMCRPSTSTAISTFVLALEAERRGYAVWHYTPPDLIFRDRKVLARAQPMKLRREKGNHFTLGAAETVDLSTPRRGAAAPGSAVRHVLHHDDASPGAHPSQDAGGQRPGERAQRAGEAVRHAFRQRHAADPDHRRRSARMREFRDEHKDIILKPLFGNGGAGVFRVRPDDENFALAARDVLPAQPRAGDRPALPSRGARRATSASS